MSVFRCGLVLHFLTAFLYCSTVIAESTTKPTFEYCYERRGTQFGDQDACCNVTVDHFRQNWSREGNYLTEYLSALFDWGCPQFEKECSDRNYLSTRFTELVYEVHCDRTAFNLSCTDALKRGALRDVKLSADELCDPCVQVVLYHEASMVRGKYGFYHEVKRDFIPFCDFTWFGVDSQNLNDHNVNAFLCMQHTCRVNIYIVVVVCALVSALGILINTTALVVFYTTKELRHSQGIFRISLTAADLLSAAVIYPTFAHSILKVASSRELMGPPVNRGDVVPPGGRFDSIPRQPGGDAWSHFESPYLDFTGFVTSIYLTATIYTLTLASVERIKFFANYLQFSKGSAKKFAVKAVIGCWFASLVVAIPSFFVNRYSLIASIMVLSSGETAIYLYIIAYVLPIVAMWIMSLVALIISAQRLKKWKRSLDGVSNDLQHTLYVENYRSRSLNITVGVFSALIIIGCVSAVVGLVNEQTENPGRIDQQRQKVSTSLEFVAIFVLVSGNLWHVLVYWKRDKKFELAVRKLWWSIFYKCSRSKSPPTGELPQSSESQAPTSDKNEAHGVPGSEETPKSTTPM